MSQGPELGRRRRADPAKHRPARAFSRGAPSHASAFRATLPPSGSSSSSPLQLGAQTAPRQLFQNKFGSRLWVPRDLRVCRDFGAVAQAVPSCLVHTPWAVPEGRVHLSSSLRPGADQSRDLWMLHNPGRATARDHVDLHVRGTLQNLPTHVHTELAKPG